MNDTVYENILIGNFLYFLGYQSCLIHHQNKQEKPEKVSANSAQKTPAKDVHRAINLFQQTPTDRLLGDVHLNFGGRNLLIEFKAFNNESDTKENNKRESLIDKIKQLEPNERKDMLSFSHKCHYLGYQSDPERFTLDFVKYVDLQSKFPPCEMLSFSNKILTDNDTGVERDNFKRYLEILKAALVKSGRSFSTAGIHINISDDDQFTFTICSSIEELVDAISDALENTLTAAPQG